MASQEQYIKYNYVTPLIKTLALCEHLWFFRSQIFDEVKPFFSSSFVVIVLFEHKMLLWSKKLDANLVPYWAIFKINTYLSLSFLAKG